MNAEALSGMVLGTCTLQQLIGRGSMGAVFLAQQSRPRRPVAVKVFLPMKTFQASQRTAFLERFRRETDAAASLGHPNIIPVHEYGEREGLAYLVMPYISGGTLRDELEREGRLPLTQVVSYLEQMAAALNFAHERGVVHRDIKPANILLTPEKRLLLTDFGLVKIVTEGQTSPNPLSEFGVPMGTPDYMSPEQVLGGEINTRTDIYSLGVLVYHMVTGTVPFTGDIPMKVALQHLHNSPPSLRMHRPDLPIVAEQVILRAMARLPDNRYSHTRDFASAFRQALETAGVILDIKGSTGPIQALNGERTTANRPRSLFDPVWRSAAQTATTKVQQPAPDARKNQPEQQAPSKLRFSHKTNLLGENQRTATRALTSALAANGIPQPANTVPPPPKAILPSATQKNPTENIIPLTPVSPPEMENTARVLSNSAMAAEATGNFSMSTAQLPLEPTGTLNGAAPQSSATGALMIPANENSGQTGRLKLTQPVKVVKVPVAGQPGQYVTGLLPVLPQQAPGTDAAPTPDTSKGRLKVAILLVAVLAILLGSGIYLLIRPGSTPQTRTSRTAPKTTPNTAATANAGATSTAQANVILTDALNRNIHSWLVGSYNNHDFNFKDGAYHIANNSKDNLAIALLPDKDIPEPFLYTITFYQVKGDDETTDATKLNLFGVVLRYQQKDEKNQTFYCFEVKHTKKEAEYQFRKYDSSQSDPWKVLWHQAVGDEYHLGKGPENSNTIKVATKGSDFAFQVNGKLVGLTSDNSFQNGQIGMLVNQNGSEVAFSNLILTHS